MFEKLKERYEKFYIRDDQLARYVSLGVITQEQANEIMGLEKSSGGGRSDSRIIITLPGGVEVQVR